MITDECSECDGLRLIAERYFLYKLLIGGTENMFKAVVVLSGEKKNTPNEPAITRNKCVSITAPSSTI